MRLYDARRLFGIGPWPFQGILFDRNNISFHSQRRSRKSAIFIENEARLLRSPLVLFIVTISLTYYFD